MNKRPELDITNPPGQIVNPIPKQECEKLTFDEWWDSDIVTTSNPYRPNSAVFWAYEGWKAAQESK